MRQLIIARKDLQMSPGKLAAQVAHASWAFLSNGIRKCMETAKFDNVEQKYFFKLALDKDIAEEWFCGIFTLTVVMVLAMSSTLSTLIWMSAIAMMRSSSLYTLYAAKQMQTCASILRSVK